MSNATSSKSSWTCLYCNIENKPPTIRCQVCNCFRPTTVPRSGCGQLQLQRQPSRTTLLWTCPRCAFSNGFNGKVCKVCQHPIPKESLIPLGPSRAQPALPWEDAPVAGRWPPPPSATRMAGRKLAAKISVEVRSGTHLMPLWPLPKNESSLRDSRTKALRIYRNAVEILQLTGGLFVDPDFLPDTHSLYYEPNDKYSEAKSIKQIVWLRPRDIASKSKDRWTVFTDVDNNPTSTDICQGVLGNCWFINALSVLVGTAEFLNKILLTTGLCNEGVYLLCLCKDGRWTPIMLDDTLPCDRHRRLHYCQGKGNQLWVALVEKAAAKLLGCYEALSSGTSYFGFSLLTGAPCQEIQLPVSEIEIDEALQGDHDSPDLIWDQLRSCVSMDFPMGANCGRKNVSQHQYKAIGLLTNCTYSVMNSFNHAETKLRLVQLRNPWGKSEWKGEWCDQSPMWTAELRQLLDAEADSGNKSRSTPDRQDDGIFWITFQDLNKYFSSVNVCEVRPDWLEIRTEGMLPTANGGCDAWLMRKIVIENKTELTLTLYQDSQRHVPEEKRNLRDLGLLVFRENDDDELQSLVLQSERMIKESVCCSGCLPRGTYIVVCVSFNQWDGSKIDDDDEINPLCVLAVHSSKNIKFDTKFRGSTEMLLESLLMFATNSSTGRNTSQNGVTVYYVTNKWAGGIVVAVNPTVDKVATVKFDFSDSTNMRSTRGTLCTDDQIAPSRKQLLNIITHANGHAEFEVNYDLELMVSQQPEGFRGHRVRKHSKHIMQLHEPICN